MKVKFVLILTIWLLARPVWAGEEAVPPSLSAIAAAAEAAVIEKIDAPDGAKITVEAQNLDARVNLPRCQSPVEASLASDRAISRNNTVKVSCISPDLDYPWQIFISVRAEVLFPVVVATRPLANGDILSADNLELKFVNQTQLRGQQFAAVDSLFGTRVKRRIAQDSPIFAANLCFVCKGDAVSVYAKTSTVEIKIQGEALADGNQGDRIKVRNINSNKVLDATVIGVGEVEIKL